MVIRGEPCVDRRSHLSRVRDIASIFVDEYILLGFSKQTLHHAYIPSCLPVHSLKSPSFLFPSISSMLSTHCKLKYPESAWLVPSRDCPSHAAQSSWKSSKLNKSFRLVPSIVELTELGGRWEDSSTCRKLDGHNSDPCTADSPEVTFPLESLYVDVLTCLLATLRLFIFCPVHY